VRLPRFDYLGPDTLEKTLDLMATYRDGAKILAGGTDLLVRMKKGLLAPKTLISLKELDELAYIQQDKRDGKNGSDCVLIGGKTPLADIITSDLVQQQAPALSQACERIGAITLQHFVGTMGGNILQDNRCQHYNQSSFHRSGRGACHKDGGKICYARQDSDRCNSTCQSDGVTALMALNASITLSRKDGERRVDLADFYTNDGIQPFAIEPDELLTQVRIPVQGGHSAYRRLSYRSAIDYPLVCAGVLLIPSASLPTQIGEARIVVGAMGRSPLYMAAASASLEGKTFDDTKAFQRSAKASMDTAAAFAVHNVGSTLEYRCAMAEEMVFQALIEAGEAARATQ
jgi:4-hydroxybenzoyl-CoA reductase subunit beta